MSNAIERYDVQQVADACLAERLAKMPKRPASHDVRKLGQTCQQVLFEVYSEARAAGSMGAAEDILRNDNIKQSIEALPEALQQLARDVLLCAHRQLRPRDRA